MFLTRFYRATLWTFCLLMIAPEIVLAWQPTRFDGDFAPSENWVKAPESEFREEICLNGSWQFQPVPLPGDFQWNKGVPPKLAMPKDDAWETTPIKIPSPWNVNTWGNGRNPKPYWPDSVYYPSYPEHWDHTQMAWMRRTFDVPGDWKNKRLLLHFEAVGGMAEIYVNGKKVGENFGRFLPFELDVTDAVKLGEENEILVGVRSLRLFDKVSEKYTKMRTPYPPGSNMDNISGIWQDVFLLAVPAVRIDDVFVKPFVHRDTLEVEVMLKNDTDKPATVCLDGTVFWWIRGKITPNWEIPQLTFSQTEAIEIPAGESRTITLSEKVGDKLEHWTMDEPNLYGIILNLCRPDTLIVKTVEMYGGNNAQIAKIDTKYTRFGWREFRIVGNELQLNGKPVQLMGDLLHPFGPFISSRDYVAAWYTMVKDMHGNAVRPHAQPHPRIYAELADEMGIAVLAETALFGSSIQLNFEEPEAWGRFSEHYRKLILRDRNHPSIFGWSWGNELFAIFLYDKNITPEQADIWWNKLAEYGKEGEKYDPTRNWFSCDGDGDIRGTSPVWNMHYGHGLRDDNFFPKEHTKPWMIGEQGGTYYARPGQLAEFNGDRAYENYRGRNEALAIDVYQNIVKIALPKLAFYSPAETAWFGIEHLPLGYSDFRRLPNKNDGVFFKPFEENKPGVQIERLPPYTTTFNPGWDKRLPLYKPLPMFEAQKTALDPRGPQPIEYKKEFGGRPGNIISVPTKQVLFLGDPNGKLYEKLVAIGVPLVLSVDPAKRKSDISVLIDGNTFKETDISLLDEVYRAVVVFQEKGDIPKAFGKYLDDTKLVDRTATQLKPVDLYYYSQFFEKPGYYFAEEPGDLQVIKCAFDNIPKRHTVYYEAAAVDWSLFNESPEAAKCAAVCLYEAMEKPSGIAAIGCKTDHNEVLFTTIDVIPTSPKNIALWKMLLYGVEFITPKSNWLVKPYQNNEAGTEWKYTFEKPADSWTAAEFDDSSWKIGKGGFGTGVPGIEKSTTHWNGTDIWLRTEFEAETEIAAADLVLSVYHDEDVEVYLNGELVLKRGGHVSQYERFDLQTGLRKGKNTLAVHCRQTAGGQYIDVGLGTKTAPSMKREHDLLMDGPLQ